MSVYLIVRSVYRWCDRVLLRHLSDGTDMRLRAPMFRLARRLFPERIAARSVGEFAGASSGRKLNAPGLPAWAQTEVATLAQLEPSLEALLAKDAALEPYFIPWDLNYVGLRYANARRQFTGDYACLGLAGSGASAADIEALADSARPLAIIDVDGDVELARLVRAMKLDYLALPAEHLDANDHCAVLARLVLQIAPLQVRYMQHPILERCIQRHGVAMASVTKVIPWGELALPVHDECGAAGRCIE